MKGAIFCVKSWAAKVRAVSGGALAAAVPPRESAVPRAASAPGACVEAVDCAMAENAREREAAGSQLEPPRGIP